MKLLQPVTLAQALEMMQPSTDGAPPPRPIAGGTDVMVAWPGRDKDAMTLLDLARVEELGGLELTPNTLTLRARATYWDVISSPAVSQAFPLLREVGLDVGAVQIQTRGTWAGNIANGSPAADGVAALLACGARVELASAARGRRWVELCEFWTGYKQSVLAPDELIVAIELARRPRPVQWWRKVGARRAQAISKVAVAVVREEDAGWRVAANSVAPYVKRCAALEAALNAGQTFASPQQVAGVLAADIAPINDIRSTARYRATVLSRLLYWQLADVCGGGTL